MFVIPSRNPSCAERVATRDRESESPPEG